MSALSVCPKCESGNFKIRDSRPAHAGETAIRRRAYRCYECGHRVTTKEYIVAEMGQPSYSVDDKIVSFLVGVENVAASIFGDAFKKRAGSLGRSFGKIKKQPK